MRCALACVAGEKRVTISLIGTKPSGFPRGELLSVGTNGANNYGFPDFPVDGVKNSA